MKKFPFTKQFDAMDCGPACLSMVTRFHGKHYSIQKLRQMSFITREGVSMLGISDAAEAIGMRTMGVKLYICLYTIFISFHKFSYSRLVFFCFFAVFGGFY